MRRTWGTALGVLAAAGLLAGGNAAEADVTWRDAAAVGPASWQTSAAAPRANMRRCVLGKDGTGCRFTQDIDDRALAATIYRHPGWPGEPRDGWGLAIYLPKGQSRCTDAYDAEFKVNLKHGSRYDNRASAVYTENSCDIKLYDGHRWTGHNRGSTPWIDRCDWLSRKDGVCATPGDDKPMKPFDNVASSYKIS
jgi:hypothetical protein